MSPDQPIQSTGSNAMLHVCSMWHTNKVHERFFEQIHALTGIKQIVIWPTKRVGADIRKTKLAFGELIEVPCLRLPTSLSSVWRGYRIVKCLDAAGAMEWLKSKGIVRVHSHSAYLDGFAGDRMASLLGAVPHAISFRHTTDVKYCFRFRPQATRAIKPVVK